jgi:hypothetical protein
LCAVSSDTVDSSADSFALASITAVCDHNGTRTIKHVIAGASYT